MTLQKKRHHDWTYIPTVCAVTGLIATAAAVLELSLQIDWLRPHRYGLWIMAGLTPLMIWEAIRARTYTLELDEHGISGRAGVGFGFLRFRPGKTPPLRWEDVTRMEIVPMAEKPHPGEEYGVIIKGSRGESHWEFEITPDMTDWLEGVGFAVRHVVGSAVQGNVRDLVRSLPATGPANPPLHPTKGSGPLLAERTPAQQ